MSATTYEATEKQIAFIEKLQAERGLPQNVDSTLTKKEASALITQLMDLPKVGKGKKPAPKPTADPAYSGHAIPAIPAPAAPLFDPTGAPNLVGKLIHVPYADSAATYKVIAQDSGFATLLKASIADPTMQVMDDWTHPLLGEAPVKVQITPGMIGMAS